MDNTLTFNGITISLSMNEKPCEIKGKGWVHNAVLIGQYSRDDLPRLLGLKLWGDEVIGVESFTIQNQRNRPIGLLLASKRR